MKISLEFKLSDLWIGIFFRKVLDIIHIWICLIPCFPVHIQHTASSYSKCAGRDLGEAIIIKPLHTSFPIIECKERAIAVVAGNSFCSRHKIDFERRVKEAYAPTFQKATK